MSSTLPPKSRWPTLTTSAPTRGPAPEYGPYLWREWLEARAPDRRWRGKATALRRSLERAARLLQARRLAAAAATAGESVLAQLAPERVAVEAEDLGRLHLVAAGVFHDQV